MSAPEGTKNESEQSAAQKWVMVTGDPWSGMT